MPGAEASGPSHPSHYRDFMCLRERALRLGPPDLKPPGLPLEDLNPPDLDLPGLAALGLAPDLEPRAFHFPCPDFRAAPSWLP